MKNLFLLLAVLTLSNQAFAGLRCSVGEEEDYAVEVNTKSDKAAFFDNNEWSIIPATAAIGVFKGLDYTGAPLLIKIDYTEGLVQHHSITYEANGKKVTQELDCRYSDEMFSGI